MRGISKITIALFWTGLIIPIIFTVAGYVAAQVPCVPPPADLVSWWSGGGSAQDIQGSNHGTLQGGTSFAPGMVRSAFRFDGIDDFVEVPDSPSLNIGVDDFSIVAWIRMDYTGDLQTIMDKRVFSGTGVELGYVLSAPLMGLCFQLGNGISYINYQSSASVQDGNFHHVAVTVRRGSSDGGRLFVDGAVVLVFDPTPYAGNLDNSADFRIGGHSLAYPSASFKGLIDEMKFFKRALTDDEVRAIFNAGSAGVCPPVGECFPPSAGLVSWWPGDGNTNDFADGNNGTLEGGATFAAGKIGQAFFLDGIDDSVNLGNASNLHISAGDFTVGAWVLFNALTHPPGSNTGGAPQGDMSILDKMSTDGGNRDGWRLIKQDNNRFYFCLGGGEQGKCSVDWPAYTVFSTTLAQTGVWYHVAAVKSSSGFAIYVNGVLEDERSPVPSFTDTNSANLRIGSYPLEGAHLNGLVDEVAIYNRALSGDEIQSLMCKSPEKRLAAKDCLPLEPGTVWKYLLNGQNEVTRKVISKKISMNGVDTSAVKYVEEGYTNYFTNDSDGILLHGQSEPNIKGVFTPPIKFSGATLGSGDSFHSDGVATVKRAGRTISVGYTADTTIGATENIAVPAGNFDAVIISLSLNLGGYAFSETLYLAEGIGIVKDVNTDSGGTSTADLVYTNAGVYDLTITGITPPKKVTLSSGTPSRTSLLKLKLQNRGSFTESIEDATMLTNLITVTAESLGACPAPNPILHTGKPQKPFPISLKPRKTLTVYYDVTFDCANDPEQGEPDYRFSAVVNRAALGGKADVNPANDTCPRDSTTADKGCADIPTDVVMK